MGFQKINLGRSEKVDFFSGDFPQIVALKFLNKYLQDCDDCQVGFRTTYEIISK